MFVVNDDNFVEDLQKVDGYVERLIYVKRVTKVVKGGRVFSFSALTVVGDGNGKIGIGIGKSKEVPLAIHKAMENARKKLIFIKLNGTTLFHKVVYKYCSTKIIMLPASPGTGVISGGAMRAVFDVLGIKNVLSKCYGSTNPANIVKAAVCGLIDMSRLVEATSFRKKTI